MNDDGSAGGILTITIDSLLYVDCSIAFQTEISFIGCLDVPEIKRNLKQLDETNLKANPEQGKVVQEPIITRRSCANSVSY